MFKKTISIIIIVCMLVLSIGCESTDTQPKQNVENTKSKEHDTIKYEVDNDGGSFSQNDLIYFIMTDRFNDGDTSNNNFNDVNKNNPRAYHGGDIKGVIEKLDYIKSLGATAIWLTPVMKNQPYGYHGYWITDFYSVDPHLGTLEDLKTLVKEAHKRDIKVILDHVVNHTGYKSPWLKDNEKKDWFHPKLEITNWADQEQVENGWLAGLPDLNQDNPEVKKYLFKNALWWIEQTGIDGMRLDTVKHVDKEFWNEFAHTIKSKYPDFYLLGEVWSDSTGYLELYHQLGIDGVTNYSMYKGITNTFKRFGKTTSLIHAIEKEYRFSDPNINGLFIDNHDNTRFVTLAGEYGQQYLKQALTFIMTYPAIPIIYYGTEIGMEGGNDPDNRRDMKWDKVESSEILKFYRNLVKLRNTNEALKSDKFELLDHDSYFMSYIRENNGESVIVVMNVQNKKKEVTVNIPTDNKVYKNYLTNETYNVESGKISLTLKPLDILILVSN
ncbi:alpha-amylase family glycosyl hydrolase [Caldisalinibacter kiritimatiensis]|uniref:alpha-amylase n=1 Tax=Caldisalinibacter kiritimatiensis TaxID=1304284 RepID=R1CVX1_9FIRM|nr:alpha-amylase family glycosyl hydrolase [Caldisalinibacter kiritimatiensis]EOD00789.1 Neopullulanase [Caldisalinibacter kiritimatiensis]